MTGPTDEGDPRKSTVLELGDVELTAARARAAAWWAAHPPPVIIERELDDDAAERLKLLGYIDDDEEG